MSQYYGNEHLSAMERHKIDLKKVREEYRIHEGDCGSSQVQSKFIDQERDKWMSYHQSK